jgi:WD40 repeat protein
VSFFCNIIDYELFVSMWMIVVRVLTAFQFFGWRGQSGEDALKTALARRGTRPNHFTRLPLSPSLRRTSMDASARPQHHGFEVSSHAPPDNLLTRTYSIPLAHSTCSERNHSATSTDMRSDWRNAIVDLTNDSDTDSNDNEVEFAFPPAIPISTPEPPSATPKSPKPSDPRPPFLGNGGHTPHHAGAHTLSSAATSASTYKAPGLDIPGRNGASSQSYVGGFGGNRGGAESTGTSTPGQSAKRRKLSVPGTQMQHTTPAQNNVARPNHQSATPSSQAAPAGRATTATSAAKVRTTDKIMSISEMKTALKTGAGSVPFLDEVLASAPRPLHIERLSQNAEVAPNWPTSSSLPASVPVQNESPRSSLPFATLASTSLASTNMPLPHSSIHDEIEVDSPLPLAVGDTVGAQGIAGAISNQFQKMEEDRPADDPYVDIPDVPQETTIIPAVPEKTTENPSLKKLPLATSISENPRVGAIVKGGFTEEDDHYLIFLKEVKKYPWRDITTEFAKHRPARLYHNLQSHYSAVLNKRNRSQDPATLNLPPHFSAEATIDWPAVHAGAPRPALARLPRFSNPRNNTRNGRAPASLAEQDYSSGADSESRRERSRRAPAVNYNWMHLRTQLADDTEQESVNGVVRDGSDEPESNMHLDSPIEEAPIPYAEATSQIDPLDSRFETDDAKMGLIANQKSSGRSKEKLPYLNTSQRRRIQESPSEYGWDHSIGHEWTGAVLHVDFSPVEMDLVEMAIAKLLPSVSHQSRHSTRRRTLRHTLNLLTEPHRLQLVDQLSRRLSSRSVASTKAFLDDARAGEISEDPQVQRLAAVRSNTFSSRRGESTASTIRQRELGLQSRRGWKTAFSPLSYQIKNTMMDTLGSTLFWTGASSDIHTVSWSSNGECFAAGAVAVTDQDSMQYNRPNNLLYSNVSHKVIHELGEHNIRRPKTETGANSTDAMFESQDPRLYTTVSSVAFSPGGNLMYSAGYDQHVYIWNIGEGSSQPTLGRALLHKAEVDMMAVSQTHDGIVATAAKRNSDNSVKLIKFDEESLDDSFRSHIHNYNSKKAVKQPGLNILPTALKFEPTYGRLLLAGFGANVRQDNGLDTTGDLCIWDIETKTDLSVHGSSRNVFDVAFNPYQRNEPFFAIGCVANGNVNRGTRSVIRLYSGSHDPIKYSRSVELECEALDMNDVVWW